jgi:hypothetical protein
MLVVITIETIFFVDNLLMFISALCKYFGLQFSINQQLFNNILDLYPELLLNNLLNIFDVLKQKKEQNIISGCMLTSKYDYNWKFLDFFSNYFNELIQFDLFDLYVLDYRQYICYSENVLYLRTQQNFMRDYENNCNYMILDEYKYYYTMDSMILRFVNSNVCTIHEHPSVFEQKIKLEMKKEKYSYCKNTLDSLRNNNDMSYNLINMLSKLDKPSRKRWIS